MPSTSFSVVLQCNSWQLSSLLGDFFVTRWNNTLIAFPEEPNSDVVALENDVKMATLSSHLQIHHQAHLIINFQLEARANTAWSCLDAVDSGMRTECHSIGVILLQRWTSSTSYHWWFFVRGHWGLGVWTMVRLKLCGLISASAERNINGKPSINEPEY